MADIDIEKKKRPIWPWILGILALIAVIFLIYEAVDDDSDELETDTAIVVTDTLEDNEREELTTETPAAVSEYMSWIEGLDNAEMGREHTFTKNGIISLAEALDALADDTENVNNASFDQKLTKMKAMADSITDNWKEEQHANSIIKAFQASVDVMQELQQSSFPTLQDEINTLQQEVSQMNAKELTLDQKEDVKSFFREAGSILQMMNNNT